MPRAAGGAHAARPPASTATSRAAYMRIAIIPMFSLGLRLCWGGVRIVNQLTDQALQNHRRFGKADLLTGLERFALATELERNVAVAEDAGGDDRSRGIGRDLQAF